MLFFYKKDTFSTKTQFYGLCFMQNKKSPHFNMMKQRDFLTNLHLKSDSLQAREWSLFNFLSQLVFQL